MRFHNISMAAPPGGYLEPKGPPRGRSPAAAAVAPGDDLPV
jgi:hypothetical protein